ncbi:MAG: 3-phosphoshikimate 1-carboxyvinyltransferase, partial [Verrucomicrobiota bacterium]|nr:3-phosphoshikimate 1-carboxyvinyltransferase [Verrucomicrobiota bacterium]
MPLPDLIEILPQTTPVTSHITVPGSKSITNRALILAALANGETTLTGALWSEDTQIMVEALQAMGFSVGVVDDPGEQCNRTIVVKGEGGRIPKMPAEIYVGNAGTAARFLAAFACLGEGSVRLHGIDRMHERPQSELFQALRMLGYQLDAAADALPAVIHGTGPREASCRVSLSESSQFASALLLCSEAGGWSVDFVGASLSEAPYVRMTQELIREFPRSGGAFSIEPDASSGSYFWGANSLGLDVEVVDWPTTGWQIDAQFTRFISLPREVSREMDLGDSIMTAIVLAPLADRPISFTDLGRLRVQECERVQALRTELTKCGAVIREEGDTLHVEPSPEMHGAEIETYNDHRMAMCFAILGLKRGGIDIANSACVSKSYPDFFSQVRALHDMSMPIVIVG